MTRSMGAGEATAVLRWPVPRVAFDRRTLLLVALIVAGTLLLRLPSFFEPPWHSDEGIFQAVAQRVANGGRLYADAWESKPPLFLYIYIALLKLFGPGVLPLRFAATAFAIGTELAVFAIGTRFTSRRAAAIAAGGLALLLAVPFWEGNLALTETFTVLPTALAVLCVVHQQRQPEAAGGARWLLGAGLLFGAAFLIRQTAAVVAVAVVLWLLLSARAPEAGKPRLQDARLRDEGWQWLRSGLLIAAGSAMVIAPVVLAFALFDSFHWFWDANIGFFFDYVPSGQELPFAYRPIILLPIVVAVAALWVHKRRGETPRWGLPVLWLVLTLAAALLTGRPYSHYMLQTFPPLALLAALIVPNLRLSWRPRWEQRPALALVGALAALWFLVVTPAFGGNRLAMRSPRHEAYYNNFFSWALGFKTRQDYNDYFDRRVNLTERLGTTLKELHANRETVYIWGEYPWVYPLTGTSSATRYVTSFYVLLIPYLDTRLGQDVSDADPRFIVMLGDAWPRLYDGTGVVKRRYNNSMRALDGLLAERYEQVALVGRARVFQRTSERPYVTDGSASQPSRR